MIFRREVFEIIEKKYSSGLVSQSFWFVETKKMLEMVAKNVDEEEIKKYCIEDNLFGISNEYRAKRIYGYLMKRVKSLEAEFISLFLKADLYTQKIIVLISIIKGDRLFFEFLYEVYREKIMLGVRVIDETDVNIFFKNKEVQSEDIEKLTEGTKKRLRSVYFNFMMDANLLSAVEKEKKITAPILDKNLECYLIDTGDEIIVKAISGGC